MMRANFNAQPRTVTRFVASSSRGVRFATRALCVACLLLLAPCYAACRSSEDLSTPERTVQAFVDRMQRVHGDPTRSRAAYELLASESQANLQKRAERASAASGRVVQPEEMIVPSRFFLEFTPARWTTKQGPGWAVVTVHGEVPGQERQIRCVQEEGRWAVLIDLPALPPLQRRER